MYPINRTIRMPAEFEQDRGFRKSLAIQRYKCFTWNFCFLNTAETDTPQPQLRSGESLSGTHPCSTKPRGRSLSGGAGGHTISQQERRGRRGHTTSQQERRERRVHTTSQHRQSASTRLYYTSVQNSSLPGSENAAAMLREGCSGKGTHHCGTTSKKGDTPLLNRRTQRGHTTVLLNFTDNRP